MTAIDLIADALPPETPPEEPRLGICCVTGVEAPCINRKHVIKPSFTNLDLLRAPESPMASVAAWRVFGYAPARQSSWWCDGHDFRRLDRVAVRNKVLSGDPAPYPWAGYATTSYKKHGALRAPVNTGRQSVWLFETVLVDCSCRGTVFQWWNTLREAQDSGIPRPVIERLDAAPAFIGKIGFRGWRNFEEWARPKVRSSLYQFLTYLLPSQEELKKCVSKSR